MKKLHKHIPTKICYECTVIQLKKFRLQDKVGKQSETFLMEDFPYIIRLWHIASLPYIPKNLHSVSGLYFGILILSCGFMLKIYPYSLKLLHMQWGSYMIA